MRPMNDHVRHHYIPQFILRNFSSEQGYFTFYDKALNKITLKQPKDVFVIPNLYKNEALLDPMETEIDLAKYEGEISSIIKEFLTKKEIELSSKDLDSLLLFLAIMSFRSKRVSDAFGNKATKQSKEFYGSYTKDGNIHDFWNKNLRKLAKHRSLQAVLGDPEIDEPIKAFMMRDTRGMLGFGLFPVVVERRGKYDFLLCDTYPTIMTGTGPNSLEIPLYEFFPLSPERMLILISADIQLYHPDLRPFGEDITRMPQISSSAESLTIKVRKFYEKEVRFVNAMALEGLQFGAVIKTPQRIKFETSWRDIL